jgi:hypothetical protein
MQGKSFGLQTLLANGNGRQSCGLTFRQAGSIASKDPERQSGGCFILKSKSRERLNTVLREMITHAVQKKIPRTAVIVDMDALSLM